jgi:MFS family permease
MMMKLARSLFAPVASLIIIMLGSGFYNTFISVKLHQAHTPNFLIGLVSSAYFAGLLVGSVRAEKLIIRIGFIRAFATFASTFTALVMANGLYFDPYYYLVLRFAHGFCVAGLFVVIESWLLIFGTKETRGKILSIYMSALYTAQAAAQVFVATLDLESILPFAVVVILASLSVVPVSMMRASYPTLTEPSYISAKKLLAICPFGFISCICGGMILSAIYSLTPVFAQEIGLNLTEVSWMMGLIILGGFLLQWPIGHLSDIFDRRKVMTFVCIVTAIISLTLVFSPFLKHWIVFALATAFGGFAFTIYPLGITYTSDQLDPKHLIAATGMLLLAYSWGSVVGPILASTMMTLVGPAGLFFYAMCVAGILFGYGVLRSMQRPSIPRDEQGEYVATPRTTPIASELDPRSDEPAPPTSN